MQLAFYSSPKKKCQFNAIIYFVFLKIASLPEYIQHKFSLYKFLFLFFFGSIYNTNTSELYSYPKIQQFVGVVNVNA